MKQKKKPIERCSAGHCNEVAVFRDKSKPYCPKHYAEIVENNSKSPIRRLTCACCGEDTWGRQWYNRDTGFGLCSACAKVIGAKETPEYMRPCYGIEGIHYNVEVIKTGGIQS